MKGKLIITSVSIITLLIAGIVVLKGMIITNPIESECEVRNIVVHKIEASSSLDIFLYTDDGKSYYINRGLERGIDPVALRKDVLYKNVTLHLPLTIRGTSNHISQLAINDRIIFTEFTSEL